MYWTSLTMSKLYQSSGVCYKWPALYYITVKGWLLETLMKNLKYSMHKPLTTANKKFHIKIFTNQLAQNFLHFLIHSNKTNWKQKNMKLGKSGSIFFLFNHQYSYVHLSIETFLSHPHNLLPELRQSYFAIFKCKLKH